MKVFSKNTFRLPLHLPFYIVHVFPESKLKLIEILACGNHAYNSQAADRDHIEEEKTKAIPLTCTSPPRERAKLANQS